MFSVSMKVEWKMTGRRFSAETEYIGTHASVRIKYLLRFDLDSLYASHLLQCASVNVNLCIHNMHTTITE